MITLDLVERVLTYIESHLIGKHKDERPQDEIHSLGVAYLLVEVSIGHEQVLQKNKVFFLTKKY
jgi:hypothetical protein